MANANRRKLYTCLVSLLVNAANTALAETTVDATINTDTIWDASGNPYVVNTDVLVTKSLIIYPGVNIEFSGNYKITFGAGSSVQAMGEPGSEIHFHLAPDATTSSWDQLLFTTGSTGASLNPDESYAAGSIFKYVVIEDTDPVNDGGAVHASTVTPYFDNVTIQNNQKSAIYISNPTAVVKITASTITQNNLLAAAPNSAITITGDGNLILEDSTITDNGTNDTSVARSVISCTNCFGIRITNNTITNNHALVSGAIYLSHIAGDISQNVIEGNVISGNIANAANSTSKGGAIFMDTLNVTLRNNMIDNNFSNNEAGAIYFTGATGQIQKNIFSNNTAMISTGAVRIDNPAGDFDITENIFYSNIAQTGHGAGVHTHNSTDVKSNKINIISNLFVDNKVLPLPTDSPTDKRTITGDCIYLTDSDGVIQGNVFTGEGYINCIYLGNRINGGIIENTFYGINENDDKSVHKSLIRLFNGVTNGLNLSAEDTPISNNNFFYNNWTSRYIDRTVANDANSINLTGNWWHDDVNKVFVTPPNTDTSSAITTPNANAPLSAPHNVKAKLNNGNINISWDANPELNVAGYNVYWVIDGEYLKFDQVVDAGLVTQYTLIPETMSGSYTIAVTAYKTSYNSTSDDPATKVNDNQTGGTESWFSADIAAVVVGDATSDKPSGGSSGGGGGAINFLFLISMLGSACIRRLYRVQGDSLLLSSISNR